jgi:hypothetical protein
MRSLAGLPLFLLSFFLLASLGNSFCVRQKQLHVQQHHARFLHPNQAADLEACAYDLIKASLSARSDNKVKTANKGPVAWCRRMLSFKRHETNEATTTTTANSKHVLQAKSNDMAQ